MGYRVKEIYFTLQGEGHHAGRAAVFLRFSGCNLWSGREQDRATARCTFCDTDFVGTDGPGGGTFATADALADAVVAQWPVPIERDAKPKPYVVCTGGEPLLQLDVALIAALHGRGFEVGVETNGTREAPPGLDWVCVSPKAGNPMVQRSGDELKLVFPQTLLPPHALAGLPFTHHYLQPMDGPDAAANTAAAVAYITKHPRWKLSVQTHKVVGLR